MPMGIRGCDTKDYARNSFSYILTELLDNRERTPTSSYFWKSLSATKPPKILDKTPPTTRDQENLAISSGSKPIAKKNVSDDVLKTDVAKVNKIYLLLCLQNLSMKSLCTEYYTD